MNNELLFLIKKRTDRLIEQTISRPQETLDLNLNRQIQIFSIKPPINLIDEGKWLLAVSFLSVQILFITSKTRRIPFQSLYQVIGKTNVLKKLLTY